MVKQEIISMLKQAQSKGNPILIQNMNGLNGPIVWVVHVSETDNTVNFSSRDLFNNELNPISISLDAISSAYPVELFGISISTEMKQ